MATNVYTRVISLGPGTFSLRSINTRILTWGLLQFRLYTGLLGQPPIWIRTDRLPVEDSDDDEAIDSDTEIVGGPTTTGKTTDVDVDDDMESEHDFFDISPPSSPLAKPSKLPDEQSQYQSSYDQPHKFKRLPPRTPYFFHNATPARVSSDEQVLKLLRLSTLRKENKLLSFLAAPDTSIKIFLSWYIRTEGLVWSPLHLHALPKLVLFFLEFLVRARVMPEADRALRRAVEIARKAVEEVPRTGKLCRMMPDKVSMGGRSCWGIQWEEDNWMSEVEIQKEAEKQFEEELKAADVEVVAASDIVPPEPKVDAEDDLYGLTRNIVSEKSDDEGENSVPAQQIPQPPTMFSRPSGEIDIQVMSPTSPGFYDVDTPSVFGSAFIEEVHESEARVAAVAAAKDREESAGQDEAHIAPIPAPEPSPKAVSTAPDLGTITEPLPTTVATHTFTTPNWALAPEDPPARPPPKHDTAENVEENAPMPWDWNIDNPSSSTNLASKLASDREAWFPPESQPFMELLGMTTLPLKFEPGVVERSMRKVREVLVPGSVASGRDDRRWKGVQEELVNRLARVVLEPWVDWDNGGVSTEYTSPKIQMPKGKAKEPKPASSSGVEEGNHEGSQHDPEKDNITILVEPQVAEHVSIGMGFAGTWVQLAPIPVEGRDSCGVFGGGRGGPRGRGRGRGGRGGSAGGRGGAHSDGLGSPHAPPLDSAPVNIQSAVPSEPSTQVDSTESSVSTRGRGSGRGGRGRGRGRGGGGSYQHPTYEGSQKEFTFWYVEGLFMVIPSFWTVGVEEEPLTMPEGGDGDLSDMED